MFERGAPLARGDLSEHGPELGGQVDDEEAVLDAGCGGPRHQGALGGRARGRQGSCGWAHLGQRKWGSEPRVKRDEEERFIKRECMSKLGARTPLKANGRQDREGGMWMRVRKGQRK